MNVTFHQSLINTSVIEFTNLDLSNSFAEPFPRSSGYNTSLINITIENIAAPNKTLNLELGTSQSDQTSNDFFAFSFQVRTTCILQNFSLYFSESGGTGGNVDVKIFIYNATYSTQNSRIEPDSNTGLIDITQSIPDEDTGKWYNFSINKLLNISKTYNNTFFIYFYQNTNVNVARAYYYYELGSTGDNLITYRDSGAGWQEIARDISCQIKLGLNDNTPKPTEINLRINETKVENKGTDNIGYWISTKKFSSNNQNIKFKIDADWWNVSLNITRVQINYTKTDIKAISSFRILGSGAIVQWNVSIPGAINSFDSRISHFNTINFTIPANWLDTTIKVFNDTIQIPSANIKKRLLGNGFREVQVLKATNGTNWYLTANSTNLMSSIKMYKTSTLISSANFSDIVKFNATFSKKIVNGNVNLTIYSPQPRRLNHTKLLDISTQSPDSEFLISTWNLSDNVTKYGVFQVLMHWDNGTDAGFLETTLTIYGDTELKIMTPPLPTDDASDVFNVRVYFNDTGLNKGIPASNFSYRIENGSIRTDNINILGDGNYSDNDFNGYGPKTVYFYAEEQYYNNQSTSIQFTILGETNLVIIRPQPNAVFNSGDTINVTLLYNDTIGISGANIQYSLNGGTTFRSDNVVDIGQGKYNITISASDSQFPSYGLNNLVFNVSKQYFQIKQIIDLRKHSI